MLLEAEEKRNREADDLHQRRYAQQDPCLIFRSKIIHKQLPDVLEKAVGHVIRKAAPFVS